MVYKIRGSFFLFPNGDVSELAEGARLEIVYTFKKRI